MILILLRARSDVPIVMMGETGCGKTSLIKIISDLKNNHLLKMDIHAGITDQDIIIFLKSNGLIQGKEDNLPSGIKEKLKKGKFKIWVFLDEINTCNSMGLISEIMCNKTVLGKPLIKDAIFIAACNPYRLNNPQKNIEVGLKKEHTIRKLVYAVHPLPYSLLNYVFDFGSLSLENEKSYILGMLQGFY